ncbi:MAG: glycosyltransferase [Planctomycetota bacterium]|nr:glycosyltransferase [Planctomycetota bacterium]
MNLLVLSAAYPSPTEPYRARSLHLMMKRISNAAQITVLTPLVFRSDPRCETLDGIKIIRYPFAGTNARPKFGLNPAGIFSYNINAFIYSLKIVLKERPKLLYANWVIPFGLIASVVSKIFGIPYILHIHGIDFHKYANLPFALPWKFALKGARAVFSAGEFLKSECSNRFSCKVQNAGLMVDSGLIEHYKGISSLRPQLEIGEKEVVVLFCGDIAKSKGVDILYKAACWVTYHDPAFLFIFIGEGPFRRRVRETSRIRALGPLAPDDALKYFACADVFVLPSWFEGLPPALVEALAAEAIPVTTPVGDCRLLIKNGSTGFIIPCGDVDALIRMLLLLRDDRLRGKMRNTIKEEKPQLSAFNAVLNWEKRMLEILSSL